MTLPAHIGSPEFHDPATHVAETQRVYKICADCRRCYPLCPSFRHLLDVADDRHDGEAGELTAGEHQRVVDLCYGCQLCWPHCPYTPPHEWGVDFPLLMQQAKVQKADRDGLGRRERWLGDPERLGRLASLVPGLANWANRNALFRTVMERVVGVDRRRTLPRYTRRFSSWFRRQAAPAGVGASGRVALFTTTPVEFGGLPVGQAAVRTLWRSGVAVELPAQVCCGMPALDAGDVAGAVARARTNLASLNAAIDRGCEVVVRGRRAAGC